MSEDKNKNNPKRPALLKDVWGVANDLSGKVEKVMNSFQTDLISWQRKITATWNTMGVVIVALRDKDILTDKDIEDAGAKLWGMNQRNLQTTKEAIQNKRKVDPASLEVDPMTEVTTLINRKIDRDAKGEIQSKDESQDPEKP